MIKRGILLGVLLTLLLANTVQAKPKDYTEHELLCRVVEAEAGNQGVMGKRLVAAVIYNRLESDKFPNTIYEVLVAPHQFGTVWNGAVDKAKVSTETEFAVMMEICNRTDNEILYFNNGACSGKFAYKYKGHNFGK